MATQTNRLLQIKTPLGQDALLLKSFTAHESLARAFSFELELLSEKPDLQPDDILGKDVTVTYQLPDGGAKRHFHGIVTQFAQAGYRRRFHQYQAVVRPWLWLLTRTSDCRVFQKKSVPEIFEEVVKEYGFSDYKLRLKGSYQKRDYCVQYRESDFDFLSRLLEQEGIYYYFSHSASTHDMVLVDDVSGHEPVDGYDSVPYYPPDLADTRRERDHLTSWSISRSVQAGAYANTAFDFENPRQSLLRTEATRRTHKHADFELFDYPATLAKYDTGESSRVAKVRIQEQQAMHAVARGRGNAAGLTNGCRFKLAQYPRDDFNIEYVVTSTNVVMTADDYDAGAGSGEVEVSIALEAIDARTPYRPQRITPKPLVHGTQTAMVVGPSGEEIHTDEHGRVKVQFHWDRYGKLDENSSCWVRVAQVWAGKNWGAIHVPRIGQEVIVSFLEGDPDHPIITGRVYNGDSKPPYDLPANKTQSGIKTRSSKDGAPANFNEIRFEDKKGEEQVYVHAEKNLKAVIENDRTITVQHDEIVEVKNDRTAEVGNDETVKVVKNHSASIGENETRSVGKNRTTSIGDDDQADVGKNYILKAGDKITLETGMAKIVMSKNGDIEISGKNITVKGMANIALKATQKLEMKGMQIQGEGTQLQLKGTQTVVEGAMLDLKGSAIASLKGALTKIG